MNKAYIYVLFVNSVMCFNIFLTTNDIIIKLYINAIHIGR